MKKLTVGETNLIAKYNLTDLAKRYSETPTLTVSNIFGGTAKLNEFGSKLYQNISSLYSRYERGDMKVIQDYDRLRYLFLKFFPSEYMDLID